MGLKRTSNRSVSPLGAAIAIIGALAIVQYYWWQGLIARRPGIPPGPPGSGLIRVIGIPSIQGIPDALVETLAGDPEPGAADGNGRVARFDGPCGLAMGRDGNMYVADSRNHRIRRIAPDGRTTTLCGSDEGYRDGSVEQALFRLPSGVAVGPDGTVYISDTGNHRIRALRGGKVTTIAGNTSGYVDGAGPANRLNFPTSLTWSTDGGGTLLIADTGNRKIRRIKWNAGLPVLETLMTTPGMPTGIATKGNQLAVAMPDAGLMISGTIQKGEMGVVQTPGADPIDTSKFRVKQAFCVASSANGWLLSSLDHACIFEFDSKTNHVISGISQLENSLTGFRDGPGNRSMMGLINGLAEDGQGHIWFTDTSNNAVRRVTLHGVTDSDSGQNSSRPRNRGLR